MLADFGKRYRNSGEKLLHFTLEKLLLSVDPN